MTNSTPLPFQKITRAIEHLTGHFREQLPLEVLAEQADLSAFHFQRLFSEWAGVSPKKFSQYLSLEYAKKQLREGNSLAEAAHRTGLSGTGRLHDLFVSIEGVTPGQFSRSGAGLVLTYATFESPFGPYVLGAVGEKITLLHFLAPAETPGQVAAAAWPEATLRADPAALAPWADQIFPVADPTAAPNPQRLPLLLRGTPFQLKVWEALLRIPEGQLLSYNQLASLIGQPTASRAVGTAIGSNPIGYLIPCHRVIKNTGIIGGYRWDPARKQAMLGWEAARVFGEPSPAGGNDRS